jgi:uncharacterized protein YciI
MQFVVTARDGTDAEAPARRATVRPTHMAAIAPMVADGRVVLGGAVLDEAGTMVGSVLIVDMASRADVDAWLAQDPYTTGGVWKTIDVAPFRVAVKSA